MPWTSRGQQLGGIAAWIRYVEWCRMGLTHVPGIGSPAVVRSQITTGKVKMVCSGLVGASDVAGLVDASGLVTQCCLLDQGAIAHALSFVGLERVTA